MVKARYSFGPGLGGFRFRKNIATSPRDTAPTRPPTRQIRTLLRRVLRRVKLDSDRESAYTTEFLDGEKSTLRGGASRIERY
jgi:hypothetical protein